MSDQIKSHAILFLLVLNKTYKIAMQTKRNNNEQHMAQIVWLGDIGCELSAVVIDVTSARYRVTYFEPKSYISYL